MVAPIRPMEPPAPAPAAPTPPAPAPAPPAPEPPTPGAGVARPKYRSAVFRPPTLPLVTPWSSARACAIGSMLGSGVPAAAAAAWFWLLVLGEMSKTLLPMFRARDARGSIGSGDALRGLLSSIRRLREPVLEPKGWLLLLLLAGAPQVERWVMEGGF